MKRVKKKNRLVLLIVIFVAVIVAGVFLTLSLFSGGEDVKDGGHGIGIFTPEPEPEPELAQPVSITVLCTGDIMAHKTQLDAQLQGDGTYSFLNNFQYIKPYVEAADMAICNVETTFAQAPYTGYPSFSTPDELAAAIKDTGFDVASTANNHMLDRALSGQLRTLEILHNNGLLTTGSVADVDYDPRYCIYETKGVKIGVISYTYQTPTNDWRVSINGSIIGNETASHINSFNYAFLDEELDKVNDQVKLCRQAGADLVILYYHWGEEYQLKANEWQIRMANDTLAKMDVDIIFGSHPHVLQQCEMKGQDRLVARDKWGWYLSDKDLAAMAREEAINDSDADMSASDYEIAEYLRNTYVNACISAGVAIPVENMPYETTEELKAATEGILPEGVTMQYEHKDVPVYYSLGNCISNQRAETLSNKYTEEGVLAMVDLTVQQETGEVLSVNMRAVPTWVEKYTSGGKLYYYIIPLDDNMDSNPELLASGHMSRAKDAKEVAYGLLGIN